MLELIARQVARLTKDVDGIKETMVTKQELKQELAEIRGTMATKQDLEEVKNTMATKQDLEEVKNTMATKQDLEEVKNTMATKQDLEEVKSEISSIKATVIRIENEHGEKLDALLNGYKQNAQRLDRVEAKLAEHDEIILKRLR